jgi:hypothetical protein
MTVICLLWEAVTAEAVDGLDLAGPVQVNLDDADVADAMLRLSTFEEPVRAVVKLPDETGLPALAALVGPDRLAAYDVAEDVVLAPAETAVGARAPGLANVALLRIPVDMSVEHWRERWQTHHTPVAIETQATTSYVQNRVLRALTDGAPRVDAIVEEQFPIEALHDLHAFYGSGGDTADLEQRMNRMLESVATFGADRDIDVIPTSRYLL